MTDAVNPDTLVPLNPPAPAPAPVVGAPAPAPAPAPSVAEGEEGGTEELDATGQPKKPIQPRINELVRKRHEAEREAAYWRGVAQAGGVKPAASAPAPAAPVIPPKPEVKSFQTYDEYVDALTDWKADRAVEKALAGVNDRIKETSSKQTADQQTADRTKNWHARQDATKAVIKDYDDVLANSDVPISPHVGELLLDSEHGPALAYKLAMDPSLAEKLNAMSPSAAAKQIGRMEAAFDPAESPAPAPSDTTGAAATPAAPPAVVKPVSKAPVPPTPVGNGSARPPDLAKAEMDDYVKIRKQQGAGWAR